MLFPLGLLKHFLFIAEVIDAQLIKIADQYNICHPHYCKSLIDKGGASIKSLEDLLYERLHYLCQVWVELYLTVLVHFLIDMKVLVDESHTVFKTL